MGKHSSFIQIVNMLRSQEWKDKTVILLWKSGVIVDIHRVNGYGTMWLKIHWSSHLSLIFYLMSFITQLRVSRPCLVTVTLGYSKLPHSISCFIIWTCLAQLQFWLRSVRHLCTCASWLCLKSWPQVDLSTIWQTYSIPFTLSLSLKTLKF